MKVLYGASNLNGSNIRLSHFLRNSTDEVRVAAHYKNHKYVDTIHWNLDALNNEPSKTTDIINLIGYPLRLNQKVLSQMLDDITAWMPDIIISDFDPITAAISHTLDIPFVSASPMNLLNGVTWTDTKKTIFKDEIVSLKIFEHAERKLIISPFGLIDKAPQIHDGFEWVKPYPQLIIEKNDLINVRNKTTINKSILSIGQTEDLYHAMQSQQKLCIADSQSDAEAKLNGIFVEMLALGVSIGEAQPNYTNKKLDLLFNNNYDYKIINDFKYLHELL